MLLASAAVGEAVVVPGDFPTIQSAIDAARAGRLGANAIIDLRAGTYRERLTIEATPAGQAITIRGLEGAASTVVDGGGAGTTLTIRGSEHGGTGPIRIERLTLTGGRGTGFAGGGFAVVDSSPAFAGVVVRNNRADFGGGGTLARSNATFVDTAFRANQASGPGGGMVMTIRSAPVFTGGEFVANESGVASVTGRTDAGGAVHANGASPTFVGTRFLRNRAGFDGGAIHHQGPDPTSLNPGDSLAVLTLEGCEIAENVAVPSRAFVDPVTGQMNPAEGGGVLAEDYALVVMRSTHVHHNVSNHGGGVRSHRASFDIRGSRIEYNSSKDPTGRGGVGGGVSIGGYAPPYDAYAVIADTAVVGNEADVGGGIAIDGGACAGACQRPSLLLLDTLVADNVAAGRGGGIFAARSTVRIDGSHVIRNRVSGGENASGGGLFLVSGSVVDDGAGNGITRTTIADNFAELVGGGLFADLDTRIQVAASRIYGNEIGGALPGSSGGGIGIGGQGTVSGAIRTSTIADNSNPQIFEIAQSGSRVEFRDNPSLQSPPGTPSQLYARNGIAARGTISSFETAVSPRASGNAAAAPAFTEVLATPDTTHSWISYAVARAGSASLSGMPGPFAVPADLELYTDACASTVTLTGSGVRTTSVAVAGGGCNPENVRIVTGPVSARGPEVRLFGIEPETGAPSLFSTFFAYDPAFRGGVTVAGLRDPLRAVVAPGPGGPPTVHVLDVSNPGGIVTAGGFLAYDQSFTGGIVVATGNVDGKSVVVTAPQRGGGPWVRVFDVTNAAAPQSIGGFLAFEPSFTGGLTIAAADVDGQAGDEIVVGAGPSGGPQVRIFKRDATQPGGFRLLTWFWAYDPRFTGGVFVGAGDVDGDGRAEIITGAGPGGGPDVAVYRNLLSGSPTRTSFFPYDARFNGGVRVSTVDVDDDGRFEVVTVPGTGGGPNITTYRLAGGRFSVVNSFFGYESTFTGGLWGAGLR